MCAWRRNSLGYTELHAEFDGVIAATKAEVGQVVQPGQEVVSVVRPEEREAVVDVPDHIAANLRPGTGFIVTSEADPATRVKGQVREIAPQADLATRTRRVQHHAGRSTAEFPVGNHREGGGRDGCRRGDRAAFVRAPGARWQDVRVGG